jgi:aryl-alcohol dehydrogenase-like predicted oxidoreductase
MLVAGHRITGTGLSNVTIEQLDAALTVAPVAAVQNKLSYADPGDLPTALAGASRPASMRDSAALLDLTDHDRATL